MKLFKKILFTIVVVLGVLIVGLIINNRVYNIEYQNVDTKKDYLSEDDINRVHEIYEYLYDEGNDIFNNIDNKALNILLYNDAYEFLFSDFKPIEEEWTYIGKDEYIDRFTYRRAAKNPQAFAIKVDDTWVGSFATMDTYHMTMLREIPILYPPQFIIADEQYYKALIIHEMVHAYQGNYNSNRVDDAEHIHNVCSSYYTDSRFNALIEREANYLEIALLADDTDTVQKNVQLFLETRLQRRKECQLTAREIHEEQEIEWLEGLARYGEFKASRDSSSLIAKNLSDISEKVKVKSDDRYYSLGMAEYMIIIKLDKKYEDDILKKNVVLEDILYELCMN